MTQLTVPILKKRLDVLLRCVRYMGEYDITTDTNTCITCLKRFPIKELQCGHFIKRSNQQLKYDSRNLGRQCIRCNKYLDGAQDKMAYWCIKNEGLDTFNDLIMTDYRWQQGLLPTLKRKDYVEYYNFWLTLARSIEQTVGKQLCPHSWDRTE